MLERLINIENRTAIAIEAAVMAAPIVGVVQSVQRRKTEMCMKMHKRRVATRVRMRVERAKLKLVRAGVAKMTTTTLTPRHRAVQ
jgi:hypothetical protein